MAGRADVTCDIRRVIQLRRCIIRAMHRVYMWVYYYIIRGAGHGKNAVPHEKRFFFVHFPALQDEFYYSDVCFFLVSFADAG